ncbi:MAG: ABC transporter substrate-binding protein [Syntrophobacterales bacterium]|jgi:phospholipid transport system substrate-binding protein
MRGLICKVMTLSLIISLAGMAAPALAGPPTEAVKSTVDQVIRILQSSAPKSQRRQSVKQTVDRRFDYEEMAKRTLPNWHKLSPTQRREFVNLFSELLEASYSDKLMKYSGEKVDYVGERVDGNRAEVRTLLVRHNDRIPINYRLLNNSRWVVYDVVIEGVSLVSNYRSQFTRVISQSSYADLVRRLRTKVDEVRQMRTM